MSEREMISRSHPENEAIRRETVKWQQRENDALRAENEKLRKALRPFAAYAKQTPIIYEHHGIRMVLVQQDLLKRLCQEAAAAIRESGE